MNRPVTTLFMLMSVDGKISMGATDALDFLLDLDTQRTIKLKELLPDWWGTNRFEE